MEFYAHLIELKQNPNAKCSFYFPYIGKFNMDYKEIPKGNFNLDIKVDPSNILQKEINAILNKEKPQSVETMLNLINNKISTIMDVKK